MEMEAQAYNPILPSWEYIPDVEPHIFDGKLFLFGSHDRFNGTQFCMNDYVCWWAETDDLTTWHFEGVIYRIMQDPDAKPGMILQAPDVVHGIDGRYYLYYVLGVVPFMSVAVSDKPEEPYEYYGKVTYADGTPVGTMPHDVFQFDPGVLVDDDGRVYLYTGFAPDSTGEFAAACQKYQMEGAYVMEIAPDMRTVRAAPKLLIPKEEYAEGTDFHRHGFYEASSIRKALNRYYFIYSSSQQHELCYAVSDAPDRGFSFGGTLISNGDIGYQGNVTPKNYTGNNHGSIICAKGQWYVFYHRHTNRHQYSRQACAEKLELLENGRFAQAEMTSCGLNEAALRGKGCYSASIVCNLFAKNGAMCYGVSDTPEAMEHPYLTQSGTDRENNPEQYIANMRDGASAVFKYFDVHSISGLGLLLGGTGTGYFEVRVAEQMIYVPVEKEAGSVHKWFYPGKLALRINDSRCALRFTYHGSGMIDFHAFYMEA